jgi:hypothetical protein
MSTVMLILVTFSGQKSTGNHVQGLLKGAGSRVMTIIKISVLKHSLVMDNKIHKTHP